MCLNSLNYRQMSILPQNQSYSSRGCNINNLEPSFSEVRKFDVAKKLDKACSLRHVVPP